jgi:hypothetical protein
MAGVYERLGWDLTAAAEAAMREWVAANPRHGRGGHHPDAADFGLDPSAVAERFSEYRRRFGRGGA